MDVRDTRAASSVSSLSRDEEDGHCPLLSPSDDESSIGEPQMKVVPTRVPRDHKQSVSSVTSRGQRPTSIVRQYSVISHKHAFDVTDYGPESARQPVDQVLSNVAQELDNVLEESNNVDTGINVSSKSDVVLDMSCIDDMNPGWEHIELKTLERTMNTTFPSVIKPQTNRDKARIDIARRGRLYAHRKKDRLVEKNGDCLISYIKVSDRSTRLLRDFFTTMLELQWRYHLMVFVLVFGLSWVIFGLFWWAISAVDTNKYWKFSNGTAIEDHVPCILGVDDYATALLFSIETQHTIGYGTRAITTSCPFAMGLMMFQSMFGVIMQCILTGIIFAKMARPKRRAQTIIFSKHAVISQRDGQRLLMFRVGDFRRSQILGTVVRVMLLQRCVTKEGESLPLLPLELNVTTESGSEFFFLAWPITIVHKIDESSPLWTLSEEDLLVQDWELIVVLEGVAEVTGATFQVRTSYLPSEVLWEHRLVSLLTKRSGGTYEIDYTHFHETEPVHMTHGMYSARNASKRQRPHILNGNHQMEKKLQLLNNNNNKEMGANHVGDGDCI